jgi:hypothetical protein
MLVMPLCSLGLLLGLMGLVRGRLLGKPLLLSAVAAALGSATLLVAWLSPGALGPTFEGWRESSSVNNGPIFVVPLPGQSLARTPRDPNWVDASRAALQQGVVRLEVVRVWVGPLRPATAADQAEPRDDCLFVRLRVHRVEGAREFAADPLGPPPRRDPKYQPTLVDEAGTALAPRNVPGGGERITSASGFPVMVSEERFGFELPSPESGSLRLAIPAAAWGGKGMFRFTIPGTMIQREPREHARGAP